MIHLAKVMHRFLPRYDALHKRSTQQYKVCRQILACRTPVLGGFHLHCPGCQGEAWLFHACRNRHCPRCQQKASEAWQQLQLSRVVESAYFHLVFTLPHEFNGWARLHPAVVYHCLFQAVWATLNTLGHDRKRLNGQLGMSAVLHTWGQNLGQHIHLHCLVPGGALDGNGQWHPARSSYLFPVRVLSRLFRGKMVGALREAYQAGKMSRLSSPPAVKNTLDSVMHKDWMVYAKHALKQPTSIVSYLSRYTRKIAISESRLIAMDAESVSFRYKDYRDNRKKTMILSGEEFLRRFLQHVLPAGFMRIRHYGWLANACQAKTVPRVREAITHARQQTGKQKTPGADHPQAVDEPFKGIPCTGCKQGLMVIDYHLKRVKRLDMP